MKRTQILNEANKIVCGDREQSYGKPESNLGRIAKMWSAYLDREVSPADVAAMMILLKTARIASGHSKADNWVDICGYSAIGGEVDEW